MKSVTLFAIQAVRFDRPDFNIGLVAESADPDSKKRGMPANIGEAFVYVPAREFTQVPAWVLETQTYKHFEKHGLVKLFESAPSEEKAQIEVEAAVAAAALSNKAKADKATAPQTGLTVAPAPAAKAKAEPAPEPAPAPEAAASKPAPGFVPPTAKATPAPAADSKK